MFTLKKLFKTFIYRCSSLVGRNGGQQSIFIGPECSSKPFILHEMFHAVGFYHEMKRFDRDQYVSINWDNILNGMKGETL